MEFESEIVSSGNPDSSQKQHALDSRRDHRFSTSRARISMQP
jgi:hypothetical protein